MCVQAGQLVPANFLPRDARTQPDLFCLFKVTALPVWRDSCACLQVPGPECHAQYKCWPGAGGERWSTAAAPAAASPTAHKRPHPRAELGDGEDASGKSAAARLAPAHRQVRSIKLLISCEESQSQHQSASMQLSGILRFLPACQGADSLLC